MLFDDDYYPTPKATFLSDSGCVVSCLRDDTFKIEGNLLSSNETLFMALGNLKTALLMKLKNRSRRFH